jgi:hypothetical protein
MTKMFKISPGEDLDGNLIILDEFPVIDDSDPNCQDGSADGLKTATTYGAAVDSVGNLFVIGKLNGQIENAWISKIDTATGEILAEICTGFGIYGITIDDSDRPWIGGNHNGTITKFDNDLSSFTEYDVDSFISDVSNTQTRGIGKDIDGNLWVADSRGGNYYVYKFDPSTEPPTYLGKVKTGGSVPVGVSGDLYGNVWAVNQYGNPSKITKIVNRAISDSGDNNTTDIRQTFDTGTGTYSYSDFVGFGLFSTVLKNSGYWRVKFDSGYEDARWTQVSWRAKTNDTTQVRLRVRAAEDETSLYTASWTQYLDVSPASLTGLLPDARWAQLEVYFYTLDQTYTPVLDDLSLNFELPVPE